MELSLTGKEAIQVNGVLCTSLANGDCGKVSLPEELAKITKGKGGNAIYTEVAAGTLGEFVLRVLRASIYDNYLNGLLQTQLQDLASFTPLTAVVARRIGTLVGPQTDTYKLFGGIFQKIPEIVINAEGSEEQGVAVYMMKFAKVGRAIY